MNYILGFVGASGSGKSTSMKYLSENYNIDCRELSARPFLDSTKGSYDEQMTDIVQTRIMLNNLDYTHRAIEECQNKKINIALSRTQVDVLAYSTVLNHGQDFQIQQFDFITYLINNPNYLFIYTRADFELTQVDDKLRGMNEEIRKETDNEILKILDLFNISYFTIYGEIDTRKFLMDNLMKKLNIKRK